MLKTYIKNIIFSLLNFKNIIPINATEKKKVIDLIKNMHPYITQTDLIRLGPNGDGGYLVPDDLIGIEACFSAGVDQISEFESDCFKKGMKIFLADFSVDSPKLDLSTEHFNFIKKFIGCTNNEKYCTMDTWVSDKIVSLNSELLLQMDIEGGEIASIISMSDSLMKRFRIMVIEFHGIDCLWNPEYFNTFETVINKILKTHICVHIHPNNYFGISTQFGIEIPRLAEFTFYRKDRIIHLEKSLKFPHNLDFDNVKSNKSIYLPSIWYS